MNAVDGTISSFFKCHVEGVIGADGMDSQVLSFLTLFLKDLFIYLKDGVREGVEADRE